MVQYNKLQKDSVRIHEKEYENLKSKDKKSYEENNEEDNQTEISRIRDFFNNFHPPFLHEMENPDLYISLIKSRLLNLCVQKNHRAWDNQSKAVFLHEYFHKKAIS